MTLHATVIISGAYIIRKGVSGLIRKGLAGTEVIEGDDPELLSGLRGGSPPLLVLMDERLCEHPFFKKHNPAFLKKSTWVLIGRERAITGFSYPVHCWLDPEKGREETMERLRSILEPYALKVEGQELEITERESLILKHIAMGYTNKEIADKLFISPHTVMTHRKNITRKLGIKTVAGLTVYAILNKIIQPEEIRR